jgi:hypothetical protein
MNGLVHLIASLANAATVLRVLALAVSRADGGNTRGGFAFFFFLPFPVLAPRGDACCGSDAAGVGAGEGAACSSYLQPRRST